MYCNILKNVATHSDKIRSEVTWKLTGHVCPHCSIPQNIAHQHWASQICDWYASRSARCLMFYVSESNVLNFHSQGPKNLGIAADKKINGTFSDSYLFQRLYLRDWWNVICFIFHFTLVICQTYDINPWN